MGWGKYGQLGTGKSVTKAIYPTLVESLKDVFIKEISCGGDHTLALSSKNFYLNRCIFCLTVVNFFKYNRRWYCLCVGME